MLGLVSLIQIPGTVSTMTRSNEIIFLRNLLLAEIYAIQLTVMFSFSTNQIA